MTSGLVSNCWQHQLDSGEPVEDLIAQAWRRGLHTIELRQGCLGACESTGTHSPRADRLSALSRRFPRMCFDIAIDVPFLAPLTETCLQDLETGIRAAIAVSGESSPHLRLVDLHSPSIVDTETSQRNLAQIARAMKSAVGKLSVEHSVQTWSGFLKAFRGARKLLAADEDCLQLCFDPCNLCLFEEHPEVTRVARSLRWNEISMVHQKQTEGNGVLPVVRDGAVPWRETQAALRGILYTGPTLLEIQSSPDVWDQIDASQEYLRSTDISDPRT